jgi:hypothetical protein
MQAAGLAILPLLLLFEAIQLAGFGSAGFDSIWPILAFAPMVMWMESRSITLILATTRGRRDPFVVVAVPLGLTALAGYILSAILFAIALPTLLRLLL